MTGPVGEPGIPPEHYATSSGMQPFEVIDEYDLGFYQGNAFKYIIRAPKKGDYNGDLGKAVHYLRESIARLPQYDDNWEWESVPWITEGFEISEVIDAFGLTGPLADAVDDILSAAQIESAQTVEYYFESAITALRAAIAMSPTL